MLSLDEKAASLRRGIFENLDETTLADLAGRMGQRDLEDGEVLFLRGEPGDEIFVIVSGQIEIFVDEHVVAVLGAGELFGEMAVLGGGLRTAGGRARGETRLLFLKEKAIKLLIQQTPDLAFAIFRVLISRLEEANRLALFLSRPRTRLGSVEFVSGRLAGRTLPLHHRQSVVGRRRGSVGADALRVALPTRRPEVHERHALLTLEDGAAYLEPLEGPVLVNGEAIDDSLAISSTDVVDLGGLQLRFVVGE